MDSSAKQRGQFPQRERQAKKTGIHVLNTSTKGTKVTKMQEKKSKVRKTGQRILADIEADKYEAKQVSSPNYRSIKLLVTDRIPDIREPDVKKKRLDQTSARFLIAIMCQPWTWRNHQMTMIFPKVSKRLTRQRMI